MIFKLMTQQANGSNPSISGEITCLHPSCREEAPSTSRARESPELLHSGRGLLAHPCRQTWSTRFWSSSTWLYSKSKTRHTTWDGGIGYSFERFHRTAVTPKLFLKNDLSLHMYLKSPNCYSFIQQITSSLGLHNNPMREVPLFLLYTGGNWTTGSLNNLLKFPQPEAKLGLEPRKSGSKNCVLKHATLLSQYVLKEILKISRVSLRLFFLRRTLCMSTCATEEHNQTRWGLF